MPQFPYLVTGVTVKLTPPKRGARELFDSVKGNGLIRSHGHHEPADVIYMASGSKVPIPKGSQLRLDLDPKGKVFRLTIHKDGLPVIPVASGSIRDRHHDGRLLVFHGDSTHGHYIVYGVVDLN